MIDINDLILQLKLNIKNILIQEFNIESLKIESAELNNFISQLTMITLESQDDLKKMSSSILSLKKDDLDISFDEEKINKISIELINSRNRLHKELYFKKRAFLNDSMINALKQITVPFLRQKGFKGSFPKFKNLNNDIEYSVVFMFSQFGNQFSVELALINGSKKQNRLKRTNDVNQEWFDYSNHTSDNQLCNLIANEIIENWSTAENWWKEMM